MIGRLSVPQAVELAKAGVKMELSDLEAHLDTTPELSPYIQQHGSPEHLTQVLRERLWRSPAMSRHTYYAGEQSPFAFMASARLTDDTIATFIVANNQALVLEDDARLFPSDALITKIRLLETK